jgi:hypothetical protein
LRRSGPFRSPYPHPLLSRSLPAGRTEPSGREHHPRYDGPHEDALEYPCPCALARQEKRDERGRRQRHERRQYGCHPASRLKVLVSTNIPRMAHTKATRAARMWTVPTTVSGCMPPRSIGKKASTITPAPKSPKRIVPTRDPQDPFVARWRPTASAYEPRFRRPRTRASELNRSGRWRAR